MIFAHSDTDWTDIYTQWYWLDWYLHTRILSGLIFAHKVTITGPALVMECGPTYDTVIVTSVRQRNAFGQFFHLQKKSNQNSGPDCYRHKTFNHLPKADTTRSLTMATDMKWKLVLLQQASVWRRGRGWAGGFPTIRKIRQTKLVRRNKNPLTAAKHESALRETSQGRQLHQYPGTITDQTPLNSEDPKQILITGRVRAVILSRGTQGTQVAFQICPKIRARDISPTRLNELVPARGL